MEQLILAVAEEEQVVTVVLSDPVVLMVEKELLY
jgi:hypothetical protein